MFDNGSKPALVNRARWHFQFLRIAVLSLIVALASCSSSDGGTDTGAENNTVDDQESDDLPNPVAEITSPPQALVSRLSLDTDFYKQYLDADGIPIISSALVNPYALLETRWVVGSMLENRSDIVAAIAATKTRLSIMAVTEFTTDIPEHSDLEPADYWDRRARGLGATGARPAMSVGEENLLNIPGDPYDAESILVHEFAHVIHLQGMARIDSTFNESLLSLYNMAMAEGLWEGTYAATNAEEYFAEGVQSWFGTNRENDAEHNDVDTREELTAYDPRLSVFLSQVFGDNTWQYERSDLRTDNIEHLSGFDRAAAGEFVWPDDLANVDISQPPDADSSGQIDPTLPRLPNVVGEDWSDVASPASSNPSLVTFYNLTSSNVVVYWVDFDSQRIQNFDLAPDASAASNTFVDHLWEVQRADDNQVIARFRVQEGDSVAIIE